MIEVPVPYPQTERKVALGMIDARIADRWCNAVTKVDADTGDMRIDFSDGNFVKVQFSWSKPYQPPQTKEYR